MKTTTRTLLALVAAAVLTVAGAPAFAAAPTTETAGMPIGNVAFVAAVFAIIVTGVVLFILDDVKQQLADRTIAVAS